MRPEQERLCTLLKDTITCLCRNGLQFNENICVQGLLGITRDNGDVFIVHIDEVINSSDGSNKQLQVNERNRKSLHVRPVKRPFQRESLKLAKKYSKPSSQRSRLQANLGSSLTNGAESNSLKSNAEMPSLADGEVQHPENWATDEGIQSTEDPIEIKLEPNVDSSQFEQLLDFNLERIGQHQSTYTMDPDNGSFHNHMGVSQLPTVPTRSWQKYSNNDNSFNASYDRQFHKDTFSSSRTSLISHQYTVGDPGGSFESGHCSNWYPVSMPCVGSPKAQELTRSSALPKKENPGSKNADLKWDDESPVIPNYRDDQTSMQVVRCRRPRFSDSKPFKCACGKAFYHKPHLRRHQSSPKTCRLHVDSMDR